MFRCRYAVVDRLALVLVLVLGEHMHDGDELHVTHGPWG
jgi:hypothetical protein